MLSENIKQFDPSTVEVKHILTGQGTSREVEKKAKWRGF